MAEIHIERKPRSVWPWIVVLVVLAVLVWLLLSVFRPAGEPAPATDSAAVESGAAP